MICRREQLVQQGAFFEKLKKYLVPNLVIEHYDILITVN